MIIDRETDFVYFSEILASDISYLDAYAKVCGVLDRHQIRHGLLEGTKDIWCRDYMPIQKSDNEFIHFRYEPSYLADHQYLQTDPKVALEMNQIQAAHSSINLDGGNVVRWQDRVIVTDRIFSENPSYNNPSKLVNELEKLLEAEVIVIPQIKSDMTGHADGMVRFCDRDTLIGNCLEKEYGYWKNGMKKVLQAYCLDYIDLPFFDHKVKGKPESAIGCYVNYLEVGDILIAPVFEVEGNRDAEVVSILSKVFPGKTVETVNINDVARYGGLLNCISWNLKSNLTL
jgi:agmatine deiminase